MEQPAQHCKFLGVLKDVVARKSDFWMRQSGRAFRSNQCTGQLNTSTCPLVLCLDVARVSGSILCCWVVCNTPKWEGQTRRLLESSNGQETKTSALEIVATHLVAYQRCWAYTSNLTNTFQRRSSQPRALSSAVGL